MYQIHHLFGLAPHLIRRRFPAGDEVRGGVVSALVVLIAVLSAQASKAEGSANLVRQATGARAALLAHDPVLQIEPLAGLQTVSAHFVYARAGEVLSLASSAQGVGQGYIAYRSPSGATGRCEGTDGLIPDRATEVQGLSAEAVCAVTVPDGEDGIWTVEFIPPNPTRQPDLSGFTPVDASEAWPAQRASDSWVWAWDVAVSYGPLDEGRNNARRGRTYVRALPTLLAPRDQSVASAEDRSSQPWYAVWVIQSADGFQYVFDTNGLRSDALTLLASSRGLVGADDHSLYGAADLGTVGRQVFFRDPFAALAQPPRRGGDPMKLFYARPDNKLPATAASAAGQDWLRPARPVEPQKMTDLEVLADRGLLRVVIEGEAVPVASTTGVANALELFAAGASRTEDPVLQVYDNLAPGETLLLLPDGLSGEVVARFSSKLAELHILLPDVHETRRGMRLRRLIGPKAGAGVTHWNLSSNGARFDGAPALTADSLRTRGGVALPEEARERVLDLWALLPVRTERLIAIPASTGGAAQPVKVAVALPGAPVLSTDGFSSASDGDAEALARQTEAAPKPVPETVPVITATATEVSESILIEALDAVERARADRVTTEALLAPDPRASLVPPLPRPRPPLLPSVNANEEPGQEGSIGQAEVDASISVTSEVVNSANGVAAPKSGIQPAPVRAARPTGPAPAPRVVVRRKPQVRQLIPGETVSFPAGAKPVTSTQGFQLAVPAGYQVYQAPEGWYFLVRVQ